MSSLESSLGNGIRPSLKAGLAGLFLLFGAAALAYYAQLPPTPKPANAPPTEFSAERALAHIRIVAKENHGMGSRANDAVRQYIFDQLKALGLDLQIQTAVNANGYLGLVQNVLARIPGTGGKKAFAMETHYDSVPYGPGAADDCGGVGAMLETARALKASPPLKNDVILIFSDMEEWSGYGIDAFLEHPWAKDMGVELGFEARGTSGPSYMFETSPNNGWLISEMMKSGAEPRATSLMYGVYSKSPFGSDFTSVKKAGYSGFNVAFVDDFCYYHTRDDRPDIVSLASLQHHGTYALAFARHFGNIPLENTTAPDAIYFNTIGSHMVAYPMSWALPLTAAATALVLLVLLLGLAMKRLSLRGLLAGVGAFLFSTLILLLSIGLLTALLYAIHGRYLVYHNKLYGLGLILVALGVMATAYLPFRKRVAVRDLAAGALVCWLAFLWTLHLVLPGGTFLALWPLAFGTVGLALLLLPRDPSKLSTHLVLLSTVFVLPGILLFVPSLVGLLAMGTLLFSALLAVALLFLYGLALPQTALFAPAHSRRLALLFIAAGLAILCYGVSINGAHPLTPHFDCLSYGLDLDQNKAYWLSNDKEPDEWTAQFIPANTPREGIPEFLEKAGGQYLKAPAPIAALQGPTAVVTGDETVGHERTVKLRVTSPEAVTRMLVRVPPSTKVINATIMGSKAGGGTRWQRPIALFPRDGADMRITFPAGEPLQLNLVEMCFGLPGSLKIPPRPDHLITEPNTTIDFNRPLRSEHTFIARTFTFPAQGH